MRRLIVLLSLFALPALACTLNFQTFPPTEEQAQTPGQSPVPATDVPANEQDLEGADINYNGIRFTLDPALGSRVYVYEDVTEIDGQTAHNTRFALTPEDYCQTWCLMVYPVAEFKQAFGTFVFPPSGYRSGAAVVFKAQEKPLSFQDGSGERGLEAFGQSHFGISNQSLQYVFRGYSEDQRYGVYVQVPARASTLPDAAPTMTTSSDPIQDILVYNQQAMQSVNALAPGDFTPNLDVLDAWISSIQVGTP